MSHTLVIFDIDGTLLYSNAIDSRCFADSYRRVFNRPFPTIDWTQFPHVTDHVIFQTAFQNHFGRVATAAEREVFLEDYLTRLHAGRRATPEAFREVPGARAIVRRLLATEEFQVGIGTGGWERPALVKLAHIGIDPTPLYCGYADGQPTREAIIQTSVDKCTEREGAPARVVYVGDAIWDVQTTRRLGMPFIGIRRAGDHQWLRAAGAQTVLTDFSEPETVLKAIREATPPK